MLFFKVKCLIVLLFAVFGFKLRAQSIDTCSSNSDSYVVYKFFATWCVPCIGEVPEYNNLVEEYKGKTIRFVTVTSERDISKVAHILDVYKVKGDWISDTSRTFFDKYQVKWIPHYVLINEFGEVGFSGNLSELKYFIEFGGLPDTTNDPFFSADYELTGVIFKYKTGGPVAASYGECTVSVNAKRTELEFKNYSILSFVGAQVNNFSIATILSDTNDFELDLLVVDTVSSQDEAMARAEKFLRNELDYKLDTVMLYREVWELVRMEEVELPESYSGGSYFGSDSVRFKYSSVEGLQRYIEEQLGVLVKIPDSFKGKYISMSAGASDSWEEQRVEFAKVGFEFRKTQAEVPFLSIQFSKAPRRWRSIEGVEFEVEP